MAITVSRSGVILSAAFFALLIARDASGHRLPLGDGHVSDGPKAGYVYSCRRAFRNGARHAGPWFHGDSWAPAEKPHVAGKKFWDNAAYTLKPGDGNLLFHGNALPVRQPTGIFPISPDDPAYQYDTNPNRIAAQDLRFEIPAEPVFAGKPGCLPMGMIGFTLSGVALFSALDDAGRDAAAHEVQDLCDGHPQGNAQYHYHNGSPCIPDGDTNKHVGWALDGFPILGKKDANGEWLTNADLDTCHGRAEEVTIDGRTYKYAYRLTREYPYTLGCFRGRLLDGTLEELHNGLLPGTRGDRKGHARRQRPVH